MEPVPACLNSGMGVEVLRTQYHVRRAMHLCICCKARSAKHFAFNAMV